MAELGGEDQNTALAGSPDLCLLCVVHYVGGAAMVRLRQVSGDALQLTANSGLLSLFAAYCGRFLWMMPQGTRVTGNIDDVNCARCISEWLRIRARAAKLGDVLSEPIAITSYDWEPTRESRSGARIL